MNLHSNRSHAPSPPPPSPAPSAPPPLRTAAVLLLAAAACASGVRAQCDVYRPGLPDFDQRRQAGFGIPGLPNNGSVHCVPTSAADAVAYAANHGAPGLLFNQHWDWANPGTYNIATDLINDLGVLMGTDDEGTSSSGYVNGMTAFINARAPGQFVASSIGWANGWGPSPERVHNLISQGGFVLVVRGTYAPEENNPGVLHRIGGHILLARHVYDACSPSPEIGMRDPNSSDSKFVNSPWGVYREDMNLINRTFRLGNGTTQARNYWEWSNNYAPNYKIMDGLLTFIPTFALTGVVVNGEEVGVNIVRPLNLTGPIQVPHVETILLPEGSGPITSIELMPDLGCILAFTRTAAGGGGGQGKVSVHDIHLARDGEFQDGPGFATPVIDTCTSPDGNIFACEANRISVLARLEDGSIRVISSSVSSEPIRACGYDDAGNTVAVITGSASAQGHVKVFDGRTGGLLLHDYPCPADLVLDGPVGICVDPRDGSFLCCSMGVGSIFRLAPDPSGGLAIVETIPLPAGSAPRNPQVTDSGNILYTSNGAAVELQGGGNGGIWRVNSDSPYSGYVFGASLSLATSRDGISRTEQTGPDTTNIADEVLATVPDCTADFNDDGVLNSQDFFDFLAAFFGQSPYADINDDGSLNSQDFFDYLTFFFRGCR